MRFSFQSGVRNDLLQEIADQTKSHVKNRNGILVPFTYVGNHGNHALVTRETYTVPVNKYAHVSGVALSTSRWQVASANQPALNYVIITDSGAVEIAFYTAIIYTNIAGERAETSPGGNFVLFEGDKIEVKTQNSDTGGLINFTANAAINEFDI